MAKRIRTRARKQNSVPTKLSKKLKLVKMSNVKFDDKLFTPMTTGKITDKLFSTEGGIFPGTNVIGIGDPGVGKSTVLLDILADVAATGKKCLFISGEMNQIDMFGYVKRYPKFGELDILFLGDYAEENPQLVIESALKKGYDLVLMDSWAEITDTVKECCHITSGATEKWLLNLMMAHNTGKNKGKHYTTFLMIQQMTKGGNFVGSNKIKHMTTAMLQIKFDGYENSEQRYIEFSKNRRGPVGKRLYFSLKAADHVDYNSEKFAIDETARAQVEIEKQQLDADSARFDDLFPMMETNLREDLDA